MKETSFILYQPPNMQTPAEKNHALLLTTEEELFATVITPEHPFRKLNALLAFSALVEPLRAQYSDLGTTGIDVEKGFKALLIQFWEDYSDREMEKCLRENLAVRWFCGFSLTETTPDYSYFSKLRTRLGTKRIADAFNDINDTLKECGLFGNVFHFIDASAIVTKTALWEERDRAIADGEETLNNAVVSQYAADPDARWGAKSKHTIWFGYKKHAAVDMRFGLIEKTTVTAANVLDFQVIGQVCPRQGMVFTDKLYDTRKTDLIIQAHGCAIGTIRKNSNPRKNRDLDRWRSGIRMPFEGTFSKLRKRARYRGLVKVTFQNFFEAIVHNLKKAVTVIPLQTAPV